MTGRFQLHGFLRGVPLAVFGTFLMAALPMFVQSNQAGDIAQHGSRSEILLPDDRLVVGMVEQVKDNEVKVNTGELMPRFLPLNEARQDKVRPRRNLGEQPRSGSRLPSPRHIGMAPDHSRNTGPAAGS